MNSISGSTAGIGIEKLVMKQGKMICYFVSISNPIITSRNVLERFGFCTKRTDICKMKEKQTPNGAIADFDDAKTTRKALEKMQLLGGE
jgi:transcription-repair coupling factor (superfamily II helicase)